MRDKALLLLLLVASGCAAARMYDGPKRPRSEVAIIDLSGARENVPGTKDGTRVTADIVQIDGKEKPASWGAAVLPGPHTLMIDWKREKVARGSFLRAVELVLVAALLTFFWEAPSSGHVDQHRVCAPDSGTTTIKFQAQAGKRYALKVHATASGTPDSRWNRLGPHENRG